MRITSVGVRSDMFFNVSHSHFLLLTLASHIDGCRYKYTVTPDMGLSYFISSCLNVYHSKLKSTGNANELHQNNLYSYTFMPYFYPDEFSLLSTFCSFPELSPPFLPK